MNTKQIFFSSTLLAAAFFLSGCSLGSVGSPSAQKAMQDATVIKSADGGTTWNPKTKIDDKKTIAGIDVLSMAINPNDPNIIYIGTAANALFATKDGGETWKQVPFANKVYGLVFDPGNPDIIYASGVFNGRAKIYKRLQEDQEWKEVYTEPADGTVITSLAIDKKDPQILFAGTSVGVIVKTGDGGQTWTNLKKASGAIIGIGFDNADDSHVFFGVFQAGVLETKNGGTSIDEITQKINSATTMGNASAVYSLVADPYLAGVVYIGTGSGIMRRSGNESWSPLNIIESSKAFPIRAIAVNPLNSKEIIYSSAKAIYKSTDSGATWSTFQLDTSKTISVLRYDPIDAAKIYAGMRSF